MLSQNYKSNQKPHLQSQNKYNNSHKINTVQFQQMSLEQQLKWETLQDYFNTGKIPSTILELNLAGKLIKEIPQCFKCLTLLKILSLNYNNITKIENLENHTKLQQLYLDNNNITKIENIENLTSLTKLYLFKNKITKLQIFPNNSSTNFCCFSVLQTLSLSFNLISTIEGILHIQMPNLINLSLHKNLICNFRSLRRGWFPSIEHLWIQNNKTNSLEFFNEIKGQKINYFAFTHELLKDQGIGISIIQLFKMESQYIQQKQIGLKSYQKIKVQKLFNQKKESRNIIDE